MRANLATRCKSRYLTWLTCATTESLFVGLLRQHSMHRLWGRRVVNFPSITAGYVAILALLYAGLSLQVIRLRRRNRVAFGDGANATLRSAMRAHAHFAEYVPITVLMGALLEMSGAAALQMHLLMGALLMARLLHPFAMYAKPGTFSVQNWASGRDGDHGHGDDYVCTAHSAPAFGSLSVSLKVEDESSGPDWANKWPITGVRFGSWLCNNAPGEPGGPAG
jgi:uncharacterized membrane protein YecN with MAPEG domain